MTVRPAVLADADAMARVHVESWRETYRVFMPDRVLDDPGFLAKRITFWTAVLGDDRFAGRIAAVAEDSGSVVGIAMAQPSHPDEVQQLHVLYVLKSHHGTGAGAALLNAVLRPDQPAALWVADPNPRAQAFYGRQRFREDGTSKEEDGVREIHLIRPAL